MDIAALLAFLFAAQWSPGPNNILLATMGTQRQILPALSTLLAIVTAVAAIQLAVAFGAGVVLHAVPWLKPVFLLVGTGLLCLIAWRLWHADPTATGKLVSPLEGATLQLVNPKTLTFTLGAAAFLPGASLAYEALTLAIVVFVIGICGGAVWVGLGYTLGAALTTPARRKVANHIGAGLILASIPFLWL